MTQLTKFTVFGLFVFVAIAVAGDRKKSVTSPTEKVLWFFTF
jgi:hypothetical protein